MNDYTHNKEPKDARLCQIIRKTITVNRKELGLEFDDVAYELGLQPGTLQNKLKPSYALGDLTISEFMHFLSLTGDYTALEYMANKFDLVLIHKKHSITNMKDINSLVDVASIENSDVFRVVKMAMSDNVITPEEKEAILREIEEAEKATAELKDRVEHLILKEE